MPSFPIALVEDDASVSRAVERLLRASGYEARTFASAEEFLASHEPERCSCLILDIHLPGMSGLELYDHLRKAGRPEPAIFITAQEDNETREKVCHGCGNVLLRKPIVGTELLAAVRAHLRGPGTPPLIDSPH